MSSFNVRGLAWILLLGLCVNLTTAQDPRTATSSKSARLASAKSIPYQQLNQTTQKKIADVVNAPSLYRRLPVQIVDCDSDLYLFLVRYPEIIVNMWRLMDATKVDLQRTGAFQLSASDGAGTNCDVELVFGNKTQHVYYAEGSYRGSLFRNLIKGRCVLLLTSGFVERDGRSFVTHRLDYFVKIDNLGAELVAKTLSPLVSKAADSNFAQSSKFIAQVNSAARQNPGGVQRMSHKLNQVQPPIRDYFSQLAFAVSQRNKARSQTPVPLNSERVSQAPRTQVPHPVVAGADLLLHPSGRRNHLHMRW